MNTVGRGAPRFSQPRRKIARALMMARRLVDPGRIGPETEIPDVQHIVEANSKRHLERKHVLIEPVHCTVDVARGADAGNRICDFGSLVLARSLPAYG